MIKVCTNCTAEYWARWRNEPVTLCVDCRADVVLCASCGAIERAPVDAAQLTLWPYMYVGPGGPRPKRHADETYTPPPKSASQAARRKYPYQ